MNIQFARAGALAGALIGATTGARAEPELPNPRRTIVVLEYRAGSPELAAIDERLVEILGTLTSLRVVGTQEARTTYSEQGNLDSEVVACSGEPACIARIGAALHADDVLLVGVSEFGDVILTLQRIDVRDGAIKSRLAEALAQGDEPSRDRLSQYLKRMLPRSDFVRFGTIRIDSTVTGATVAIDGLDRGRTPTQPLKVRAPATYQITVEKDGYVPFHASVAVPPDGSVKVRPALVRKAAWYKTWWFAAAVGTVAAGVITTFVVIGRDDPTDVPGTIPPF